MSNFANQLLERIKKRSANIGIIGMGYVGLPLAIQFAKEQFHTTGFDIDQNKIDALMAGQSYIKHIPQSIIRSVVTSGLLQASANFDDLSKMDVIIVCVPTPLSDQREPDLGFVISTSRTIKNYLRPGQLVVLESTTYPGTCDEVVRPILDNSGLKIGKDIFLAYSPEREDPGNAEFSTGTIPKVVGGNDENSSTLAVKLYGAVIKKVVPVSSMSTAEAVKITENVFRAINIALVNELKIIYSSMGIDIWEVIQGASTKPFGFMPFYPGPGLGGHCIPIDPFYLSWKARQVGLQSQFIELAGEINTKMPIYVVDSLEKALLERFSKPLSGAKIIIIGIAYKKNCADTRESPALTIIKLLEERGANTVFHDPLIPAIPDTRDHGELSGRQSIPLDKKTLASSDAALICTDHDDIDYRLLAKASPLVVDTRNAIGNAVEFKNIINA
ncbi:MAG: UDP-N-acetyl-D-glucosamine dehydrogenase [Magnetovibrio sp.]|nr:UDP-N-acetyl-D-glucosamine dehydrogenase [Magnetovibrio sp.]